MNTPSPSAAATPAAPSLAAAHGVYVFLLAATGLTWFLGETGAAGPAVMAVLMGAALLKGLAVTGEFMELRHAPRLWQAAVAGWLIFVTGCLAAAYLA